jgi:hypothetical protein
VLESRGCLDFTQEALGAERVRQLLMQDLQGDRPVVAEVVGQVHCRHASAAEFALQRVTVAERLSELGGWCGHQIPMVGDASNLASRGVLRQRGLAIALFRRLVYLLSVLPVAASPACSRVP